MKTTQNLNLQPSRMAALLCTSLAASLLLLTSPLECLAQDAPQPPGRTDQLSGPAGGPGTPAAIPAGPTPGATGGPQTPGGAPPPPGAEASTNSPSEEIQLSFQMANVDMIVQWLAQTTGKSVIKHPRVQCQLTIVASKKVTPREAISLVYRALAMEGFTAIESSKSILIVPEGQEPKGSPELLDPSRTDIPEGRQRLVKIFPLQQIQATELREKVRGLLSEKGTIDIDDRANQLVVTDYTENLRLLADLIKVFDVTSSSDSVVEFFPLKFAEAEELGTLLGLILNAQVPPPSPSGRSSPNVGGSPGPGGGSMPPGMMSPPPPSGGSPSPGGSAQSGGQQIRIWPDRTANRLIVLAPKSKFPEIRKLLEVLDTEKPRDLAIRVIPVKNVHAEDIAKELAPLYQKMSGKSLKETIEVTADTRSGSLIVLSSEANFKAIQELLTTLDTEDAQEKIVKTFPLKSADAEDVAKQLQELNKDQDSSSRYPYFFFSSSPSQGSSRKLSVVADRRRNSLIVQAPPSSMENIAKMIAELDEPVDDNSLAPKIFPLKYVSAVDIEDVLNELFLKKQQQRSYWSYYDDYPQETSDRNVGKLYCKVRITSEPYSNSIIVTSNSPENLAAVEEVLKKLDAPSEAGETTLRVALKFARAPMLANNINILFAKGGAPALRQFQQQGQPGAQPQQQPQQPPTGTQANFELEQETKEDVYYPWLGGQPESTRGSDGRNTVRPVSELVGRVRVVADNRSNSLLVTANLHFFPQVLKLIEEMDAPTAQVLIEAKIIEVSSDFRDKLGVRWSPDGTSSFDAEDKDNGILIGTKGNYKKGFGGPIAANGNAPSAIVDALHSGVIDSSVSLDFLIQFLRKNTDSKILAQPQISIADNELGRLFVGAQVPVPASSTFNAVGQNNTFTYKPAGIILEVTPHINSAEEVGLRIRTESSTIRSGATLLGGAIFDTRNFRTDMMVKNGQTLVLGGIIQREETDIVRKVPVLGSIPGLGWAFKKKDKVSHESELMVFLRPTVIRTTEQAKKLLDDSEKLVPNIKKWEDDTAAKDDAKSKEDVKGKDGAKPKKDDKSKSKPVKN